MSRAKRKYTDKSCIKFVKDMEAAGLEVEHYRGRFFWEGPAVRVDHIDECIQETKVKCQWDQLGLGSIVYPRSSDPGTEVKSKEEEQYSKQKDSKPKTRRVGMKTVVYKGEEYRVVRTGKKNTRIKKEGCTNSHLVPNQELKCVKPKEYSPKLEIKPIPFTYKSDKEEQQSA